MRTILDAVHKILKNVLFVNHSMEDLQIPLYSPSLEKILGFLHQVDNPH